MIDDCDCEREIEDDGKNFDISIFRDKPNEEIHTTLFGYNEIGKSSRFYDISYQYLKGDISIDAHIRFVDDKVSYINCSYVSSTFRDSFSYRDGKYIGV